MGISLRDGEIRMPAIAQAYAHGDGANVEILHLHHADGFDDLLRGVATDAHAGAASDAVHELEHIFGLGVDPEPHFLALGVEPRFKFADRYAGALDIHLHYHHNTRL